MKYDRYYGDGIGRTIIYTDEPEINSKNIIKVLTESFAIHEHNSEVIDFLIRYEGGRQTNYRPKTYRKDIDARCVDNVANEITEFKLGFIHGQPITLVQRGENDGGKEDPESIAELNEQYAIALYPEEYQKLARFVEICGIGYEFIDINKEYVDGDSYISICALDPRFSFVVRSSRLGHKVMLGVTYSTDKDGNKHIDAFTERERYIFDSRNAQYYEGERSGEFNPLGVIPIVEWTRSADRMGCFERQISEMDNLNQLISDFTNDVGQNTNAVWWANNVEFPTSAEIDDDGNVVETVEHPNDGDWLETSTTRDGKDPKIAPLSIDYDYEGMLNNILARRALILQKCHVPQRADSENSTGIATSAASGWDDAEVSAARQQLIMESCKMREVRVVLQAIKASSDVPVGSRLRKLKTMDVMPSIKRQKNYELVSKMNFFATGISHGLHPKPLIKEMNAFADPEQVYLDSKPYLEKYIKATFEKNEKQSDGAYNGYGWYRNNADRTGDGGTGERTPNADRIGQDESDQVSNSPNIKG